MSSVLKTSAKPEKFTTLRYEAIKYTEAINSHHCPGISPQMRFDCVGFLVGKAVLLALAQLLDQAHGLSLQATSQLASDAAGEQLHQLEKGE